MVNAYQVQSVTLLFGVLVRNVKKVGGNAHVFPELLPGHWEAVGVFFRERGKIISPIQIKVVILQLLSRAKAVSKKSIANILSLKIRQLNEGGLSIICFRLNVYAIYQ